MYARNSATPRPITVGSVVLIADGTVQTTGVSAKIRKDGGTWTAGSGSTSVEEGVWSYTPTQGETDCETLEVLVYKASCYQAWQEVITTAVSTYGKVQAATVDDKTGYSLATAPPTAAAIASAVWSAASRTLSAFGFSVTVGTNNDKTGYSLATAPPTAAAIADAVWDEATAGHTTDGTYGGRIIRSTNSNVSVQVTGASHIAADVHEFQTDVLTSDATAASFVTEIQSGLATAANQTTILNRLGSWTGTGLNTILGAFRAIAGKATGLTPSDISSGTTYDNTTDSLEAIRDRGDAAWAPGEAGSGDASQSTLLDVQDSVEAIQAALGGSAVSVTNRVADGGAMTLYTGDDMRVRSGTSITVAISDAAGGIYTRLSGIGAANLAWGAARQSQAPGAISGTVSSVTQSGSGADQVVNLVIEINDAGQSLNPADDYVWQVVSTSSDDDEYTEIEGTLDLRRRVAVPV
jgi:hypothetical protein